MHRRIIGVVSILAMVLAGTACRKAGKAESEVRATAMVQTFDGVVDGDEKDPRKQARLSIAALPPEPYQAKCLVAIRSSSMPEGTVIAVGGLPEVTVPKQPNVGLWARMKSSNDDGPRTTSNFVDAAKLDGKLGDLDLEGKLPLKLALTLPGQAAREFQIKIDLLTDLKVKEFISAVRMNKPEPFAVPLATGARGYVVQLREDSPLAQVGVERLGDLRFIIDGSQWKEGTRQRTCEYLGGTMIERQFSRVIRVVDRATHSVVFERSRSTRPPTAACPDQASFGKDRKPVVREPYDEKPDDTLIADIIARIKAGESLGNVGKGISK